MTIETARAIVSALTVYFGLGGLIGLPFVFAGAGRIDPAAKTMPLQARLLILPASIALWPLILVKWMRQKEPPIS